MSMGNLLFSDVLRGYFQDARSELSYLAHHASEVDKYRAESCGVIGMQTLNTLFCLHI